MTLDLLLTDAVVVDGTGRERFEGSVGVVDGTIEAVARGSTIQQDAARTVDVGGDVVAPGFVDVLSYADLDLFEQPDRSAKVGQGVTTELVGASGYSMAPLWYKAEESNAWRLGEADWRTFLSAQFGRAEATWDWGSVAQYLDAVADAGPATNVATFVGHHTLRHNVTGLRELPPTEDELREMCDLLEMGLMDGALGLSTSATLIEGVVPTEIEALVDRLAERDRPLAVATGGRDVEAFDVLFEAAAEADVPVHLCELTGSTRSRRGPPLRIVASADDADVTPTSDVTPYETEVTMLASLLPEDLFGEGEAAFRQAIEDPTARDAVREDLTDAADWSEVSILPTHEEGETSIATLAASRDAPVADLVCELLASDLETAVTVPTARREAIDEALLDDRVTVATGGSLAAWRTRRAHGTFAAFVGDLRRRTDLGLEEAIRKVTFLPATRFGLAEKGRIVRGADADLVVFDPDAVADRTSREAPRAAPAGVDHVLVDGTFTVRAGEITGERAGEPIRLPNPE